MFFDWFYLNCALSTSGCSRREIKESMFQGIFLIIEKVLSAPHHKMIFIPVNDVI